MSLSPVHKKTKRIHESSKTELPSFEWLIHPLSTEEFFNEYWEKKPLLIQRKKNDYYNEVCPFTYNLLLDIMKEKVIMYGDNINVVKYIDGEKVLMNQDGQLTAKETEKLWKKKKASLQVFQPHKYSPSLCALVACLEDFFSNLVGGSAYLTPPNSQALAPHFDDVEVFIMQTEGSKKWKLWSETTGIDTYLPREHSPDLPYPKEKPLLDITLEKGDFLYMPRGTIHVAETTSSASTHITLSTYQKHTYFDLYQSAINTMLHRGWSSSGMKHYVRPGLPIQTIMESYSGRTITSHVSKAKEAMTAFSRLSEFDSLLEYGIEHNLNEMREEFILNRLPPPEQVRKDKIKTMTSSKVKLSINSNVSVIYPSWFCLSTCEEGVEIIHCLYNNIEHHMDGRYEPRRLPGIIIDDKDIIISLKLLVNSYPTFHSIKSLYTKKSDNKKGVDEFIEILEYLWENGIIISEKEGGNKEALLGTYFDLSSDDEDNESL